MRILLVEDNERLARFVVNGLQGAGFVVDWVGSADEGEAALRTVDYDVLVLDLGLPDYDGLVLLRNLRASGASIPVLVLTARDHVSDRVKGLNLGADDYLVKPFALEEVVACLRALLRRPSDTLSSVMTVGNMGFDVLTRELVVDGTAAALSRRESDVLEILVRRVGRVVPKRTLDEKIYGFEDDVSINSIEVTVSRLRRNLKRLGATVTVRTFRGVGYLLEGDE
jgi:two-component system, OmpR family, response regulator QseB